MKWKTESLGEIALMTSGGTPSKKNPEYYENGTIPWVRSGELENGAIRDTEIKITQAGLDNSSAKIFPKGTLLIALYGATIGKLAWLDIDACTNQAVCGIFENEKVSLKYLYYYLLFHRPDLIKQGVGGAQANISQTILKKLMVSYPVDMDEQLCIVARIEELFSELDNGVETLRKTKQQLAVYRQAVLKQAFDGKLTACASMREYALKDLVEGKEGLRRGPFGSAIKKAFFVPDGYKVYEQGNAINNDPYRGHYFITREKYEELKNFHVKPHDLLVSCSGVTLGRIVELPDDAKPGVINQALLRIRLKSAIISSSYFIEYFRSELFQRKIFAKSQGSAMPNLVGIAEFKEITLRVPATIEEQTAIVREIDARLSICDSIEKTVDTALQQAEAMRQSILKKAFEGDE